MANTSISRYIPDYKCKNIFKMGWTGPFGGDFSNRDLNCDGGVDCKDESMVA